MKNMFLASVAVIAMTGASFAQADMEPKGTKSNGSNIGQQSSQVTGNGDWTSGNGTGAGTYGAGDQTTTPGSRADAVHNAQGSGAPGQVNKK